MLRGMIGAVLVAGALGAAQAGAATTFSAAYVFGDSLSDNGNAADALGTHLPNPPFFHDSFTNGEVAVQVMAERLGLAANPALFPPSFADPSNTNFLTGGTNYAFAGATAGSSRGQGQPGANLANQITYYLSKSGLAADPNALYTVFIGGNDVRRATQLADASYLSEGVATEAGAIQALIGAGAQHLLILNVPDIGRIPEYELENPGQAGLATAYTISYNAGLASLLAPLAAANSRADIKQFDLFAFNADLLADAATLGITNTTDRCYTSYPLLTPAPLTTSAACGTTNGGTSQANNIASFYYWDNHHPTAKVQAALGMALADFVTGSQVPEPATWAMMLAGFCMIGATIRRREVTSLRAAGRA